ncbi:MAG: hypothetical protein M0R06_03190 [Sphaerochaeta sp.]|jgi:hypothetical protein|nr:hypothetical protein [Sphaerochaeta sp.]
MAYGWFATVAEADGYFEDERLETSAWDALTAGESGGSQKAKALVMAYNRIYYSGLFTVPTLAAASAAQLVILKKAQAETAYYLALHLEDEDRRKGLHAQGVVGANIVGETYVRFASDTMDLKDVPLPPIVYQLMSIFSIADNASPFYAVDIDRDENESVNTDVTDF